MSQLLYIHLFPCGVGCGEMRGVVYVTSITIYGSCLHTMGVVYVGVVYSFQLVIDPFKLTLNQTQRLTPGGMF